MIEDHSVDTFALDHTSKIPSLVHRNTLADCTERDDDLEENNAIESVS